MTDDKDPCYPTKLSGYSLELKPYCSHCPKFDCDSGTLYADDCACRTIIFCCNQHRCECIIAALHNSEELHNNPVLRHSIFREIVNTAL